MFDLFYEKILAPIEVSVGVGVGVGIGVDVVVWCGGVAVKLFTLSTPLSFFFFLFFSFFFFFFQAKLYGDSLNQKEISGVLEKEKGEGVLNKALQMVSAYDKR